MVSLSPADPRAIRGILSMIAGGGALTVSAAATKWLTASLPIGQVLFMRALVVAVIVAAVVCLRRDRGALRIVHLRGQAARAALAVCSTFLIVGSLAQLPFNEVIAILFVGPLFIAILAGPVLGERVGIHRWLAVLVGFTGMLIMVRPGSAAFQYTALLPVAAALAATLRDLITRRISGVESSTAILLYTMVTLTLAGLATSPFGWRPMDLADIATAVFTGVMFGLGHFFVIEAYRHAEATVVAPYRYGNLIWAALLGFVVWHEIPSLWVLAGTPLVVGSGLYILWIERARRRHSS